MLHLLRISRFKEVEAGGGRVILTAEVYPNRAVQEDIYARFLV
jgi:hypothetical protein